MLIHMLGPKIHLPPENDVFENVCLVMIVGEGFTLDSQLTGFTGAVKEPSQVWLASWSDLASLLTKTANRT